MTWYYVWKTLETPSKLLKLIIVSKITGNKVNMQKWVAFLYTNNELSERKVTKIIPFITASKKKKKKNT